ncbi:MAK10-like protein [Tanacetum coccineum]
MGDANPIFTLGDYSKPSHEGYRNTIELPVGNNVVPLRSNTIRIHHHMGGSYYSFPCSILSTGKDCKTPQRYPDVPTTSWRISLRSMDSFQGLNPKSPLSWHRSLAIQFFYDHVSFHLKCEIDRAANGKLHDKNTDESWEIIENLALYDHEGWNDSKEFAKPTVTKNVNSISLAKGEEERNDNDDMAGNGSINRTDTEMPVKEAKKETEDENGTKNKPIKRAEREETVKASSSQPVGYYLKHRINEKLIEGLVDNHRFNDSLSGIRVGKVKGKTYNLLPRGPVYEVILRKRITRKEDIGGNFEIPSEDVLVDVDGYVYPVDFMILDIKEDEKRPFILGTSFMTTVKAVIKFDKGTIILRSGKSKISFHRIPESLCKVEKGIKNDIEPIAPTMTVNRNKHPALVEVKNRRNDEGEVT